MTGCDLPLGISVHQVRLEDNVAGVHLEVARDGHRIAFGLREGEAIAIALAILRVSIEIRDTGSPMWRLRLIEGGRAARSGPIKP
jgi:hypothetical protein